MLFPFLFFHIPHMIEQVCLENSFVVPVISCGLNSAAAAWNSMDKKDSKRSPLWSEDKEKGPLKSMNKWGKSSLLFSSHPRFPGNSIIVWQCWPGSHIKLWGKGILYDLRNCGPKSMGWQENPVSFFSLYPPVTWLQRQRELQEVYDKVGKQKPAFLQKKPGMWGLLGPRSVWKNAEKKELKKMIPKSCL